MNMKSEIPSDYEACGECGFDNAYEYEKTYQWHKEHDDPDAPVQE